jgi:hypothetical protein
MADERKPQSRLRSALTRRVGVAYVVHPSTAAGVPLLIGGAFAAVTIFPTRTVARMLGSATYT